MDEIEVVIVGDVQGVGFRDFVQRSAQETNIIGMVENLSNGNVLVVGQGVSENLQYFIEFLNEGPVLARIDEVRVAWQSPKQEFEDFHIRY